MSIFEFLFGLAFWGGGLFLLLMLVFEISRFFARRFWEEHVHLDALEIEVIASDGKLQPEGNAYPDTDRIRLIATLTLNNPKSLAPFTLAAFALNRAAKKRAFVETTVKDFGKGRVTVHLGLNPAAIIGARGKWEVRLLIGWFGVCLGQLEIEVPRCASGLIESLDLRRFEFHVARGADRSEVVSYAHKSASPSVTVFIQAKPHGWPPEKYDMNLWGAATHVSTQRVVQLSRTRMVPSGEMINAWLPCNALMEESGEWEIKIGIGDRVLANKSFTVVTAEEADQSVKVEAFCVETLDNRGLSSPLSKTLYASEILSLRAHLTLATPFPSSLVEYNVRVLVLVGKTTVSDQTVPCILSSRKTEVLLPEIATSTLLSNGVANSASIEIRLNERHLIRKRFLFREAIPPFAQVEALLIDEALRAPKGKDLQPAGQSAAPRHSKP